MDSLMRGRAQKLRFLPGATEGFQAGEAHGLICCPGNTIFVANGNNVMKGTSLEAGDISPQYRIQISIHAAKLKEFPTT